ncbi:HEPN domain-containing protein [Azospirillum sp. 11R-A]|uniref:HEPN domain-containing protein n=1 Tax=Azospirillum sp. 11R-A TaxID=3111634 RepID=UPI003C1A61CF
MNDNDRSASLEEARRWWRVAAEDRRVAQACLAMDPPSLGNAAYHCQQAAEKLMKGLLVSAGLGFRKVHDLDELASVTAPLYPELADDLDHCRPFTSWATEYRYPPEDESPPPSPDAISEALAVLERLLAAAARLT